MDEFLCVRKDEGGTEFGNIFEAEKLGLAQMFDVVVECRARVSLPMRRMNVLSGQGDGGCGV